MTKNITKEDAISILIISYLECKLGEGKGVLLLEQVGKDDGQAFDEDQGMLFEACDYAEKNYVELIEKHRAEHRNPYSDGSNPAG